MAESGKKKILIVDDQADFTLVMKTLLENEGYEVVEENNGLVAVQTTRRIKPDLILMDVNIPGSDGSIIAAEIKEDSELKHIPLVFLTAMISSRECSINQIGGYTFLSKAASINQIVQFIETLIKK
jgi:CheY-like chemotaxis protein